MIKERFIITLFIFSLILPLAQSQTFDFKFENYTTLDGLSDPNVNTILQDSRGYLWIGTNNGLNRWNGYEYKIYKNNPNDSLTISDNFINVVFEDTNEIVWIGTYHGLCKYDRNADKFINYYLNPSEALSLSYNNIKDIQCFSKNQLLLATQGGGLLVFNTDEGLHADFLNDFSDDNSIQSNNVNAIFKDEAGTFWVGTNQGLSKIIVENEQIVSFKNYQPTDDFFGNNSIVSIMEDKYKRLWLASNGGGVMTFSPENNSFSFFDNRLSGLNSPIINVLFADSKGRIWIGSNAGLHLYDKELSRFLLFLQNKEKPCSLNSNKINTIYEDKAGIIWFGTNNGINKLTQTMNLFKHFLHVPSDSSSLINNNVNAIRTDAKGRIWIGTDKGLDFTDGRSNTFTHYRFSEQNAFLNKVKFSDIYQDYSGIFWFATWGNGLVMLDPKTETVKTFLKKETNSISDNHVRLIYEDRSGMLWISTLRGLNSYDRKKDVFRNYLHNKDKPNSISHNFVTAICEDRKGNFWLGTKRGGLNLLDRDKGVFTHFKKEENTNSISDNSISTIIETKDGKIWIGTRNGLNEFDFLKKKFVSYHLKDGLCDNYICAIQEDANNHLWISTKNGMSKFIPKDKLFINFSKKNGLQANEFNVGASRKGRKGNLLFGGVNGFNMFVPDSIKKNRFYPLIIISSFKVKNVEIRPNEPSPSGVILLKKDINETEEIILSPSDNNFSFEFSASHFVSPQYNKFLYKMDGYDEDWTVTDYEHRYATYMNLPEGVYVFRVRAANSDGIWNEVGKSIVIKIGLPFWRHLWFQMLIGIGILALLFAFYKSRVRELTLKNNRGKRELSKIKKELVEKNDTIAEKENRLEEYFIKYHKLESLIQEVKNAVYIVNPQGEFEWVNQGFVDLYHYNMDSLASHKSGSLYRFMNDENLKKAVTKCCENFRRTVFETKVENLEGKTLHVKTTINPIINDKGEVVKMIFVDSDISEEVRLKKELDLSQQTLFTKQSEFEKLSFEYDRLNEVVGKTENAILMTDKKGNFIWVNEAYEKLFGYNLEELKSQISSNIIGKNTPAYFKEKINKCLIDHEFVSYEYTTVTREGKRVWVLAHLYPIFSADNEFEKIIVVDSDITPIKELEKKIDDRNKKIANYLAQQKEQAAEIAKAYKEMHVIGELGQKIITINKFENIIRLVYEFTNTFVDAPNVEIGIYNEKFKQIRFSNSIRRDKTISDFDIDLFNENNLSVWSFRNLKSIYIQDYEKEYTDYIPNSEEDVSNQPASAMFIPLLLNRVPVGVLVVQSYIKKAYLPKHLVIMESLASYIAISIEQTKLNYTIKEKNRLISNSQKYLKLINNPLASDGKDIEPYFQYFLIHQAVKAVSTDTMWFFKTNSLDNKGVYTIYIAIIDCLLEDIPGTLLGVLVKNILTNCVRDKKIYMPDEILNELEERYLQTILSVKSKMNYELELGLCRLDKQRTGEIDLTYCGARRPLYYYSEEKDQIKKLEGARKTIAKDMRINTKIPFENKHVRLYKNDMFYLFTDGIAQQIGANRKKFGEKRLKDVLELCANLSIDVQEDTLLAAYQTHKANEEQKKDITVLGVKLT